MAVLFPVAAASRQIFIVEFGVLYCRFFFYHEALPELLSKRIKVFALVEQLFLQENLSQMTNSH